MTRIDTPQSWKRTKHRVTAITLGVFSLAALVVGRAALVQVKGDARLADMARKQFHSKVLIRPRRGLILDRNGEPLAVNVETRSLAANPSKLKGKPHLIGPLAKLIGIPAGRLREKLRENKDKEFVWIKRHISDEAFDQFRKIGLIGRNGELIEGLWLIKESQRVYPHAELAANLIGTVNIDADGVEGVEYWQNERLRGKIVSMNAVRDALGRPTFIDTAAAQDLKDGEPVTLTIDTSLQFSVEQELKDSLEKTHASSGSVIVMNADNGEILAFATAPGFNPNLRNSSGPNRRARPLTDGYEPGSTVKPLLMAAALSSGMKPGEAIWGGKGQFIVQGRKIREAEAHEQFEWITLKRAVAVSSNVAMAKVALKLGAEKYTQILKLLGLGSKPQTGFPGEIAGWIPPVRNMPQITLANLGFGQGLFVSPVQVVRAYSTLMNGGWLIQPKLIKDSGLVAEVQPRKVFSRQTTERVTEALLEVTESDDGTGHKARLEGYRIAGKTGTSQVVDPRTRHYSLHRYMASFIGFAVDVEPKLLVYTMLDGPQGSYYATDTAAPLFQRVLQAVANRFGLPAKSTPVIAKIQKSGGKISDEVHVSAASVQGSAVLLPSPAPAEVVANPTWEELPEENGKKAWKTPALTGLTAREVFLVLKGRDLNPVFRGFGVVKQQSPQPGSLIRPGDRIEVRMAEE